MDPVIVILVTLAIGIMTVLFFMNKKSAEKIPTEEEAGAVVGRNLNRQRANADHPARNRLRNRNQIRNVGAQDDEEVNGNEERENDGNEERDIDELNDQEREELRKRIGTKKLAKMEGKAEKKRQNEEMLREREERREQEELRYEERKKAEEEEERLEKQREEEERLVKEEEERREHEEYLKLKEAFSVEEEGQGEVLSETESQNLLLEFVEYIKKSKVVVLEDLAAEFNLKTQDVINRVNMVQEMGLLTGVMDDRGKFIYISEEELLKVKKFIELRGRVNITEIAKSSNELINLQPEVAPVAEISDVVEAEA